MIAISGVAQQIHLVGVERDIERIAGDDADAGDDGGRRSDQPDRALTPRPVGSLRLHPGRRTVAIRAMASDRGLGDE